MKDQLFKDASAITRGADELQVEYTTGEIVVRIWREHLRPRIGLLLLASFAMLLTAAATGAIPFLIQRTADDVFVAKNEQMVYWITAAIVIVTVVKAIAEYVADVTVAEKLSDKNLEALKGALKSVTGNDVGLNVKVDPAIIGGLTVKLGSRMVDSSLRTKLNSIKHAMKEAG